MSMRFPHRWKHMDLFNLDMLLQFKPEFFKVESTHSPSELIMITLMIGSVLISLPFMIFSASGRWDISLYYTVAVYGVNFMYQLLAPYPYRRSRQLINHINCLEMSEGLKPTSHVWLYWYYVVLRKIPHAGWSPFVVRQVLYAIPLFAIHYTQWYDPFVLAGLILFYITTLCYTQMYNNFNHKTGDFKL